MPTEPTALLALPPLTAATALVPAQGQPAPPPAAPAAAEVQAPPAPDPGGRGPDDAAWATAFGSPSLGSDCLAVAVDGEHVWVGGDFRYGWAGTANDTFLRVAHWDGTGWRPLGRGVDGAVRAVVVVGGDVYVGGDLRVAGGTQALHLARWDGAAWSAVAGGVSDPDRTYGTTVNALATDGTRLYVGGVFTRAGTTPVNSLAVLDLATGTWSDAAGGVRSSWSSDPAEVRALAVREGRLLVGGGFDLAGSVGTTSLAELDPASGTWSGWGTGVTDDGLQGFANAIAVDPASGTAYVGGRFTRAGDVPAWNLVALGSDGYAPVGDVSAYGGSGATVLALAVSAGTLYAGGEFTTVGGASAERLARWDGSAWSPVGDGVDNVVHALAATPAGGVVVLGDLVSSGDLRVVHGGVWTGERWESFGQGVAADPYGGGTVSAVVPAGDGAYVGGLFDQAGAERVGSVAQWDGQAWHDLAGGVTATSGHGQVFAMLQLGADLYVAGSFQTAGGAVVNNIARWDGTAWYPLGDGLDDAAYALAVLGGRLYVGGTFTLAGRVDAGHLACWDPATQTWSAVGNSPRYDDDIRALAVIGDRWLAAGGTFQRFFARGTTVVEGLWGMALFDTRAPLTDDPASGYLLLAGTTRYGAPGWVDALQVVGGDLYVGGSFDVAGKLTLGPAPQPGFPCANVAVWHFAGDGTWEQVAGGTDARVQGLAEVDGTLAVGGWFSRAGRAAAARVARHDPAAGTWTGLGSGLADGERGASWALCLAQSPRTGLWVGGQFPVAGGAPSDNLALWTATAGG